MWACHPAAQLRRPGGSLGGWWSVDKTPRPSGLRLETEAAKVVTLGERVWPKIGPIPNRVKASGRFFGLGHPTKEETMSTRKIAGPWVVVRLVLAVI
jgi:hypothetical protein